MGPHSSSPRTRVMSACVPVDDGVTCSCLDMDVLYHSTFHSTLLKPTTQPNTICALMSHELLILFLPTAKCVSTSTFSGKPECAFTVGTSDDGTSQGERGLLELNKY